MAHTELRVERHSEASVLKYGEMLHVLRDNAIISVESICFKFLVVQER